MIINKFKKLQVKSVGKSRQRVMLNLCAAGAAVRRPPAASALPKDTVHLQPRSPELAPNVPCYQNESAVAIN